MIEEIHRKYLQIKSLRELKEVKKPSENYTIHQVLPENFQLNKFLYKQIGRKYQWIDRLTLHTARRIAKLKFNLIILILSEV